MCALMCVYVHVNTCLYVQPHVYLKQLSENIVDLYVTLSKKFRAQAPLLDG